MAAPEVKSPDVVGLGQCSWDLLGVVPHYPQVDRKAELQATLQQGGGPVATALVTLARLGVRTAFLGSVGDDAYGSLIRGELQAENVDCRHLRVAAGGTSQAAFIIVEASSGHRNIFWHRGERPAYHPQQEEFSAIAAARVLLLDGLELDAAVDAAAWARENGVATVLDGGTFREGTERLLPFIDHLVVSERFADHFAPKDPERACRALSAWGAKCVVATCGSSGSLFCASGENPGAQAAFPVDAVDTTGCGDVFHGAYIYGLLQKWPLPRRVRFASACAAMKARQLGGRSGIPGLSEVNAFLAGQS